MSAERGSLCLPCSALLSLRDLAKPQLVYLAKVDDNVFFSNCYCLHRILQESDEIWGWMPKAWGLWWVSTHCHSMTSCPLSGLLGRLRTTGRAHRWVPQILSLLRYAHSGSKILSPRSKEISVCLHQRFSLLRMMEQRVCGQGLVTLRWCWILGCAPLIPAGEVTGWFFPWGGGPQGKLHDWDTIYKVVIQERGSYPQPGAAQPLRWGYFLGR